MKITGVDVFVYDLAYRHGAYAMSKGRSHTHQQALVVRLRTDAGIHGWGETCPMGRTHLTAFFEGERAALAILGPAVIGLDPRETGVVQAAMARALLAGMAAKSAIDIACWDIAGKAAGVPVATLLGGRQQERVAVWESLPLLAPAAIADHVAAAVADGVRVFQLKVGGDPYEDAARVAAVTAAVPPGTPVVADANGGWNLQHALIAAREMADQRIYLEQPCLSAGNCAELRRHTALPMIVDECVGTVADLVFAKERIGAGGVNVKPGRLGGLTPARLLRDMATELGMMVTIDDSWGGALTTAALSHLAISTKPDALLATTFFTELTSPMIADAPRRDRQGHGTASTEPGLGCTVDTDRLGASVFHCG